MKHKREKTPLSEFDLASQHMVMPQDLNPNNTIFGGVLLAWLDVDAYLYCVQHTRYTSMVTVGMDRIKFISPARSGDIVQIHARILSMGKTSVTVEARATLFDPIEGTHSDIIDCEITYVAIDERGKPTALPAN